ncbi:MAG: elongation factor P maturation arginine rhamnosyltransferase EarP [Pseudomonadota bacterium]
MPSSASLQQTPHAAAEPPLLWDVFCRVIDNFGDLGVCWRLCADLATRGHRVRLWVDDASALQWMAPAAREGGWPGVQVLPWNLSYDTAYLASLPAADVWIEGFGCEIAPEFIAHHVYPTGATGQFLVSHPVWINLEYLSAESFVERSHGLPSPVMSGPAKGWTKHFFYPGFTGHTGGLLREPGLLQRQQAFMHDAPNSGQRTAWLAQWGIDATAGETLVSLFCYEPAALPVLLAQLDALPTPTRLLVAAGRGRAAVQGAIANGPVLDRLRITYLPTLTQQDFDHLLWACDLNCVRGEDSVVRALWAGKPLVWQIYPQDDAAHVHKLDAFLDMLDAGPRLRAFHHAWNAQHAPTDTAPLPTIDLPSWSQTVQQTRQRLLQMDDLAAQLLSFTLKKR